jgi:hypothetical protein
MEAPSKALNVLHIANRSFARYEKSGVPLAETTETPIRPLLLLSSVAILEVNSFAETAVSEAATSDVSRNINKAKKYCMNLTLGRMKVSALA